MNRSGAPTTSATRSPSSGRPRTVAVTTLGGERPAFHRQFELEPNGRGTRLSDRWELDLGYPRAVQRLAAPRVTRAVGENLAVLKRLLERDREG